MSQRELQRVKVIENAVAGHITVAAAGAGGAIPLSRQSRKFRFRAK